MTTTRTPARHAGSAKRTSRCRLRYLVYCTLLSASPSLAQPADPAVPQAVVTPTGLTVDTVSTLLHAESWPIEPHFEVLVDAPLIVIGSGELEAARSLEVWQVAERVRQATGLVPFIMPSAPDDVFHSLWSQYRESWLQTQGSPTPDTAEQPQPDLFQVLEAQHLAAQTRAQEEIDAARGGHGSSERWAEWVRLCDANPSIDCSGARLEDLRASLEATPDEVLREEAPPDAFPRAFGFTRLAELHTSQLQEGSSPPVFRVILMGSEPEEIFERVGFGGFNECPDPQQHAQAYRLWNERHGTHLVFMGPDTLEFWVRRPPTEPDEVRLLAWQQFVYCRDLVLQGTGSLPLLARELSGNNEWFFWWD